MTLYDIIRSDCNTCGFDFEVHYNNRIVKGCPFFSDIQNIPWSIEIEYYKFDPLNKTIVIYTK